MAEQAINQLFQLAQGIRGMREQAADEKYKELRTRLAEEELDMAKALKPFHMAQMENDAAIGKIKADTARYEQNRSKAAESFIKWDTVRQTGDKEQANRIALDFYNNQVFDGKQAAPSEKGGFIITDQQGKQTEWNPTDDEIAQSWQGYIAKDPVEFFKARKDEELARFNYNYNATLNRRVFMDSSGNLAWWTDGVDIKTGKAKGMGVDGNGRQYMDPQELQQKGFRLMGTIDDLAKDPDRLEQYLNARDALEARTLEQKLFRSKQLIEAEQDPRKKAAMVEAHKLGLVKLEFLEQRGGKGANLSSQEMGRVESYIKQAWNTMDELQQAQYDTYDQFADGMRVSLVQQLKAEKKAALMSGFLAADNSATSIAGSQNGEKPVSGVNKTWKDYQVKDKSVQEKKQPNLAEIAKGGSSGGW